MSPDECLDCKHLDSDDVCADCSVFDDDQRCTCSTSNNPPCSYCEGAGSLWEEDNEDLTGDSNMSTKTQEIFSGTVTENEKIKNDNGQIESIKKRVIFSTIELPAFDAENAKVKIMTLASKVTGDKAIKDIDEVEIKVYPFPGK